MMYEVVFLNEGNIMPSKLKAHSDGANVWYLDNGVSNHMIGNCEYFSKIEKRITGKVRFADSFPHQGWQTKDLGQCLLHTTLEEQYY